ncbi:hypothetical protein S245_043044 [Arachis hypogaea]
MPALLGGEYAAASNSLYWPKINERLVGLSDAVMNNSCPVLNELAEAEMLVKERKDAGSNYWYYKSTRHVKTVSKK